MTTKKAENKDVFSILGARNFVKFYHGKQERKYTGEPYYYHCEDVAEIVAGVTEDANMICSAFLHDVLEDTDCTKEEILNNFNQKVLDLVVELTDVSKPEDGNRKLRKQIDKEHLAKASPEAQIIKYADIIDNSQDICEHDPKFAKVYLEEAVELLNVMNKGNKDLRKLAIDLVQSKNSL